MPSTRNLISILSLTVTLALPIQAAKEERPPRINPVDALGLDLLQHESLFPRDQNAVFSPLSIELALAMAYLGTDGSTREEMSEVMHLGHERGALRYLESLVRGLSNSNNDEIEVHAANRLFVQSGYPLLPTFLDDNQRWFGAHPVELDFRGSPRGCSEVINEWVSRTTRGRITRVIDDRMITAQTRLLLVNALYLNASWSRPFDEYLTSEQPFTLDGGAVIQVPTLYQQGLFGYRRTSRDEVINLPYAREGYQLSIIMPASGKSLEELEKDLTPARLAELNSLPEREIRLYLPKFSLNPGATSLRNSLIALGMPSAFDEPRGSANFDRTAPRRNDEYLSLADVVHQATFSVDEEGTEAAAATAVIELGAFGIDEHPPPVVRVDRPFFFALRGPGGACLFMGHVNSPAEGLPHFTTSTGRR